VICKERRAAFGAAADTQSWAGHPMCLPGAPAGPAASPVLVAQVVSQAALARSAAMFAAEQAAAAAGGCGRCEICVHYGEPWNCRRPAALAAAAREQANRASDRALAMVDPEVRATFAAEERRQGYPAGWLLQHGTRRNL
jgi:hypothetical protein